MFLQNLAYARLYTSEYKAVFKKDQVFFELRFSERKVFNAFLGEIAKICICTDFNEKYSIFKFNEMKPKFKVIHDCKISINKLLDLYCQFKQK